MGAPYAYGAVWYAYGPSHMRIGKLRMLVRTLVVVDLIARTCSVQLSNFILKLILLVTVVNNESTC